MLDPNAHVKLLLLPSHPAAAHFGWEVRQVRDRSSCQGTSYGYHTCQRHAVDDGSEVDLGADYTSLKSIGPMEPADAAAEVRLASQGRWTAGVVEGAMSVADGQAGYPEG